MSYQGQERKETKTKEETQGERERERETIINVNNIARFKNHNDNSSKPYMIKDAASCLLPLTCALNKRVDCKHEVNLEGLKTKLDFSYDKVY